jgi:SulP family sulfate permease
MRAVLASATSGGLEHVVRSVRPLLPRREDYAGPRRFWVRDLAAGVTVGIVALPLALAFGVATGVGTAVTHARAHGVGAAAAAAPTSWPGPAQT